MNITIVSDFNTEPFANLLKNFIDNVEVTNMPYGQVYQNLFSICELNKESGNFYDIDFLIIWTKAENIFPEYNKSIQFVDYDVALLDKEFNQFKHILQKCSKVVKNILVFSWVKPENNYIHGLMDYNLKYGSQYLINYLNNKLSTDCQVNRNVYIINTNDLILKCEGNIIDNKMKYLIKMPYSLEFLQTATLTVISCIDGVLGRARRVLVLDLDNTLWGGILGDDGIEGINIGGHDLIGEAFLEFQKAIKTLKNKGIALAIASKNYEENALNAIENNKEMYLKKEDFSAWRINWKDKAANIVEIAEELNLGLKSFVFIDDNPVERARVLETLPDVIVPNWPESPVDYTKALLSLDCFNVNTISDEDKKRSKMFAAERDRKQLKDNMSHEEWLASIKIKVEIEAINNANKQRITQLLNKSNQFNAITRRLSEVELENWLGKEHRYCWGYRVSDKYGESGLTAIITFELNDNNIQIYDFVMSCRVMGRNIENIVLKSVIEFAEKKGKKDIRINYQETERNQPIKEFLDQRSGFKRINGKFVWNTSNKYEDYTYIEVLDKTESK